MKAARRTGEIGDRRARPGFRHSPFPMRTVLGLGLLGCLCFMLPARATALYRCVGSQGETVLTNFPSQYHACKWISGSRSAGRSKAAAAKRDETRPIAASQVQTPAEPAQDAKADPAVIQIMPLRTPGAPAAGASPSSGEGVPQIAKPWPIAVMDTIATNLLPALLEPSPPQPAAAASAGSSLAPPAQANARVAAPEPKRGAVYKVARADGTIEYTNIASRAQGANATMLFTYLITCYACNVHSRVDWNAVALHLDDYDDAIHTAAAKNGVSEALLRAIIHAESGFNPRALSYKGAQGLMQLMPGTASDMGVTDAFDVSQNISGGAKYLAQLLHDFNGNVQWAVAAYNAGEAAVRKYNGVPPYDETQVYVKRVAILRDRYLKAVHPAALAAAGVQ